MDDDSGGAGGALSRALERASADADIEPEVPKLDHVSSERDVTAIRDERRRERRTRLHDSLYYAHGPDLVEDATATFDTMTEPIPAANDTEQVLAALRNVSADPAARQEDHVRGRTE